MNNLPEAKIAHLAIYPIKSGHRLEVNQAKLTPEGLEMVDGHVRDHDFMVVDAIPNSGGLHMYVQQRLRGMNIMTQIQPSYEGGNLVIRWQGSDPHILDLDQTNGVEMTVGIWDDAPIAIDQGNKAAEWFSGHLNRNVRLVRAIGKQFRRLSSQDYMINDNSQRFHDGYPVLIGEINDVKELEQIAGMLIGWERFRPQIVTEGFEAQYMHSILKLLVTDVPMLAPKPCIRCPITQINQESGQKGREPKKSLEEYKVWADKDNKLDPIFFENGLPQNTGVIKVGDLVKTVDERPKKLIYSSRKVMNALQA